MRHPCLMAFLLLFPLGGRPAASAQAPPANQGGPKAPEITSKRLQEGYDKLRAGMTVGQLTELLGPLTSIKAPGDPISGGLRTRTAVDRPQHRQGDAQGRQSD